MDTIAAATENSQVSPTAEKVQAMPQSPARTEDTDETTPGKRERPEDESGAEVRFKRTRKQVVPFTPTYSGKRTGAAKVDSTITLANIRKFSTVLNKTKVADGDPLKVLYCVLYEKKEGSFSNVKTELRKWSGCGSEEAEKLRKRLQKLPSDSLDQLRFLGTSTGKKTDSLVDNLTNALANLADGKFDVKEIRAAQQAGRSKKQRSKQDEPDTPANDGAPDKDEAVEDKEESSNTAEGKDESSAPDKMAETDETAGAKDGDKAADQNEDAAKPASADAEPDESVETSDVAAVTQDSDMKSENDTKPNDELKKNACSEKDLPTEKAKSPELPGSGEETNETQKEAEATSATSDESAHSLPNGTDATVKDGAPTLSKDVVNEGAKSPSSKAIADDGSKSPSPKSDARDQKSPSPRSKPTTEKETTTANNLMDKPAEGTASGSKALETLNPEASSSRCQNDEKESVSVTENCGDSTTTSSDAECGKFAHATEEGSRAESNAAADGVK
eukprot:Selendium_serpulae@DN4583_c0_g1_i1.p1